MAKTSRIELRVTPEMREAIDAARGDVPLNRWCQRALESALAGSLKSEAEPPSVPQRAPTRTPAFNRATNPGVSEPRPKGGK